MKKLLALVLALVMTLSLATVSSNAAFKDAKDINETYAEAAEVLAGMGVFKGYEEKDGTFSFNPKGDITRAEVAAIIYRIYTADVAKNDKSGLYATYNKFSDMAGAGWAAGYIGYCANAEFVKGYPDGTFKPLGKVTGYEVLAMILRAVGYDKLGEFTGAGWQLHVAQIAEQNKILKNVKGVDLNAAATRELVAELLFQAVQIPMVTYTAAFGYQNVTLDTKADNKLFSTKASLGTKNFNLDSKMTEDAWGRPVKSWYNTKTDASYAKIAIAPDAAFQVATSECDICEALGEKKGATISNAYENGIHYEKYNRDISATATKATLGAQGQQIEFYAENDDDGTYRMVTVDTYLAQVEKVVTEKLDGKNHVTRDDYVELTVYGKIGTYYVAGNDYAEGDWLLVNVNDEIKNGVKLVLTTNAAATKVELVEVVQKAESFEGAQSKILSKAYKHIIDGKDYMDAYKFVRDDAKTDGSVNYTWFLDQFGNLIGDIAIDNTNYAVLKDIEWVGGTDAHAQATIVYMDGEEASVEVATIDGLENKTGFDGDFDKKYDDAVPEKGGVVSSLHTGFETGDPAVANVSTDDRYNTGYLGMALYKVETNKDGSVNLQGEPVYYTEKSATIKTNTSVITDEDGDKLISLDDNTKFLVRETKDGKYVYTPYTLNDLPDYAKKSVEAYYTVDSTQKFANRVYIKLAADQSDFGHYIFVPEYDKVTDAIIGRVTGKYETWEADVYVDGVLKTIRTNASIAATLQANEGKLFSVEWEDDYDVSGNVYGFVKSVDLVNEHTDNDTFTGAKWYADYVFDGTWTNGGNSLASDSITWRTGAATFVSADGKEIKDIDAIDFDEQGVWVVSDASAEEGKALYVYVGKKLSADTDLYAYYRTDKMTADDDDKYLTFEYNKSTKTWDAKVDLAADEKVTEYGYRTGLFYYWEDNLKDFDYAKTNLNAYVKTLPGAGNKWLANTNDWMYLNGATGKVYFYTGEFMVEVDGLTGNVNKQVTVTAEDGVTTEVYNIVINNGRELCTSTDLTYLTKDEKFRTYDIDIQGTTVNVYLNGNETVTVGQLLEVLYVSDGAEKCTHATIAPYNSQVGTAAVLSDLLKAGKTDFILTVTPESGDAVDYTVSIH